MNDRFDELFELRCDYVKVSFVPWVVHGAFIRIADSRGKALNYYNRPYVDSHSLVSFKYPIQSTHNCVFFVLHVYKLLVN